MDFEFFSSQISCLYKGNAFPIHQPINKALANDKAVTVLRSKDLSDEISQIGLVPKSLHVNSLYSQTL